MAKKDNSEKLLPGNAYRGIGYGPTVEFEYEEQERRPVDGSNSFLRSLSPFRMSFVLPGPYGTLRRGDGSKVLNRDLEQRLTAPGQGDAGPLLDREREQAEAVSGDFEFEGGASEEETQRVLQERGLTGIPTTRSIGRPFITDQYDRLYDAAQQRFNSFEEARATRRTQAQFTRTYTELGGTLARVTPEEFIVNGERRNTKLDPRDPRGTDKNQALDIATQLLEMMETPPLTLLINPTGMDLAINKVLQFTERTRNGFLLQDWGDEQPTLNLSLTCGAWIVEGMGVQFASKRDSAAWQNLMLVYQMYRNNGYIYDRLGRSQAMHAVGGIALEYDGWVYVGNFNSFSYSEEQEKPHGGIEFSMEFTVNAIYDNAPPVTSPVEPMRSLTPNPVSTSPASRTLAGTVDVIQGDGFVEERGFFTGIEGIPPESNGDAPSGSSEDVPPNTLGAEGTAVPAEDFDFEG